jgi:hypothetical protein
MKGLVSVMAVLVAAAGSPSHAKALSGDVGLYSQYLDYDLFVLTDEPVVQAGLNAQISEACTLMAWGSHGVATKAGGELDLGALCSVGVGDTTVSFMAMQSILRGVRDATTVSVRLARGNIDLNVEHYLWAGNPDGSRIYGGYRFSPSKTVSLHPFAAFETGIGAPDIFALGLDASLALTADVSLVGLAMVPLARRRGDPRKAELSTGIRYSF